MNINLNNYNYKQNFGVRKLPAAVPAAVADNAAKASMYIWDKAGNKLLTREGERVLGEQVQRGVLYVHKVLKGLGGLANGLKHLATGQTDIARSLRKVPKEQRPELKKENVRISKELEKLLKEQRELESEKDAELVEKLAGTEDNPKKLRKKAKNKRAEKIEKTDLPEEQDLQSEEQDAPLAVDELRKKVRALLIDQAKLAKQIELSLPTPKKKSTVIEPEPLKAVNADESPDDLKLEQELQIDEAAAESVETILLPYAQKPHNEFVMANEGLVKSIAKRFTRSGLQVSDIIQEGYLGLMKAVTRFKPEYGYKFSTYGSWWIHQCIARFVAENSRRTRFPVHLHEKLSAVAKTQKRLEHELGRIVTVEELATKTGFTVEQLEKMRLYKHEQPSSLSRPIFDDGKKIQADNAVDETAEKPFWLIEQCGKYGNVANLLDKRLKPRHAEVLKRRFGVGGFKEQTLEEAGDDMRISRERVRQIEVQALKRLVKVLKVSSDSQQ